MGLLALSWLVLGWVVGAGLGHAAKRLVAQDAPAVGPRPLAWLGPLGVDPPLQGTTAVAFGVLALRVEPGLPLLVYSLYAAVLLALLFVDWRVRYVYDVMVYPAIAAALVLTPAASGGVFWQGLAGAAIGGAAFGTIYLVGRLVYRGGVPMGEGDISLAALMGGMLGHEQIFSGLFLAALLGAVLGLAFGVRYRSLKISMPYGPGLCLATLVLLALR